MSLPKPRRGWYRVRVTCPHCEAADVPANYWPGSPRVTGGPPDSWYPGDPPEIDYDPQCPECGEEIGDEHYDDMLLEAEEAAGDDY